MFLYNTYQWDWTTIAALVAPRPLLFANSDNDPIFPMDGNRRIIQKLRSLYKMYGKPELVDDYVSSGGHAYRPDLRIAIFKFINKHLKSDTTTPVKDAEFTKIDGKLLRVFPTDDDVPKDAINAKVDETFVPRAKVELPSGKSDLQKWRATLLDSLRQQTFRNLQAKHEFSGVRFGNSVLGERMDGTVFLLSEQEFANRERVDELIKQHTNKEDVYWTLLSLFYRLPKAGEDGWTRKSPPNYPERSHVLLGRTIDELRVRNFIASLQHIRYENKEKKWKVIGCGQMGILAAYAALFEPSIKEVVIIDPPVSHKEGPYFLNVLRVLDIPEALGLLAPNVKLTLINARDPAFERTAEIYRRAGAAEKFVLKKGSGE
jgi:hypothetical protein